jgi:hypothetical protein
VRSLVVDLIFGWGRSLCSGEMNGRSPLLILIGGDRFVVKEIKGRSLVVDFGLEAIAFLWEDEFAIAVC